MIKHDEQARNFMESVSEIVHANPFLPERIAHERRALGANFDESAATWNLRPGTDGVRANVTRIEERTALQVEHDLQRMLDSKSTATRHNPAHLLYADCVIFLLYSRYSQAMDRTILDMETDPTTTPRAPYFAEFKSDVERYLIAPAIAVNDTRDVPHLFATIFQIRRAFHHIQRNLTGASPSAALLRANVWQSIFSHDMRRYRRMLFHQMGEYTTLITGASGTGKELVASAIGHSRYAAFDARSKSFKLDSGLAFLPLNLAALPSTLVESTLFGHRRGAFTGAVSDHPGTLAVCPQEGTVFLDEIGDLEASVQVKLLRLLQARTFVSLGDQKSQRFAGKLIAATNRDLVAAVASGELREDFYYRLCADVIAMPTLKERIREEPGELRLLIDVISRKMVGAQEYESLARETERWIAKELPDDYSWPGNIRELEQCVQNVLLRGSYRPLENPRSRANDAAATPGSVDAYFQALRRRELNADDAHSAYCALVYAATDSYVETARLLAIDRRTARAKILQARGRGWRFGES